MTEKVLTGDAALDALNEGSADSGENNEFTYLKSGDKIIVKVPGINMISEYVYGNFAKKIYSFIAKNPSKKSQKGFPVEDLTPFDMAWKYYKDQSEDWQDEMSQQASVYRCTRKFTIGFYDLDTGDPIMVEFTRNQASAIVENIKKYSERLDQFAFELAKSGKGTGTTVSLSLIPILDDLTEKQRKNFEEAPSDFDASNFNGLYYEMDDDEMIAKLTEVGFDVTLVGLEPPSKSEGDHDPFANDGQPIDIDDEDMPF